METILHFFNITELLIPQLFEGVRCEFLWGGGGEELRYFSLCPTSDKIDNFFFIGLAFVRSQIYHLP